MQVTVNEIFYSIQGEGRFSGLPCVFVRLTGCNLRCRYCDTRYAYHEGAPMPITQVAQRVMTYACPLVLVTGGEPLMQKETPTLITALLKQNLKVLVETNGSFNINVIPQNAAAIMDIKCPSSGESEKNDLANLGRLKNHDEVKFVIENIEDYAFAKELLPQIPREDMNIMVHFSPVQGKMEPGKLARLMLKDHLPARLNLQLHKVIWPHEDRGV